MRFSRPRFQLPAAARRVIAIREGGGRAILQSMRAAGPYLVIELLLPGGTLMALLLYLYRQRAAMLQRASP